MSLKSRTDTAKFVLFLLLSLSALMLLFIPEESATVFAGDGAENSFSGIMSLIEKNLYGG